MFAASQAVVDVLVRVPKVVECTKARHAFVIAKGLKGIFQIGDNPLSTDSPYLEESDAVELMKEIMVSVQKTLTKHIDIFDKFVDCSEENLIAECYDSIVNSIKSFQNNPNDPDLLANLLAPDSEMSFTLFQLQSQLYYSCGKRYKPAITTVTKLCYKSASKDDPTWGFETGCEFFSALLAVQRVAIEVMRRVMNKGGVYETQELLFKKHAKVIDTITKWRLYTPEHIEREVVNRLKDVDACVDLFYKVTDKYWQENAGQIHKLPIYLSDSPPIAVSHNQQLYFVSSRERRLVKYLENTCSEASTSITLSHITHLVSHNGKLYCIAEFNNLYEIDPQSDRATLLIEDTPFKLCTSMVGLGDYLYITLNTYLNNFYRVDLTDKSYMCLGDGWCGAGLITLEGGPPTLYARYSHTLSDSIYNIDYTSSTEVAYTERSKWWTKARTPRLVSHGSLVYTSRRGGDICVINTNGFQLLNRITRGYKERPTTELTPLTSHGMSVVCQHFNDWRYHPHCERRSCLVLMSPLWVDPPQNWFEEWLKNCA